MKLKFSVSVSLTRSNGERPESPNVVEHQGSNLERSERHPIGFAIEPTNPQDPFETEEKV